MFRTHLISLFVLLSFSTAVTAETINYEGSSTVGKFISDAAEVYTDATFKLNTVPESSGGEQCVMRQKCDMGGVAREINDRFLENGVVKTLIAKDAIAAIVNSDNPVTALSTEQLRAIFTGKITNWSEVGGNDLPIKAFVVKEASATRQVFASAILAGESYNNVEVITPDAKMLSIVGRDPSAIGQLSFAFLGTHSEVKALQVDGHLASVDNKDYPITRPLYITTHGEPSGAVKTFLDWTLSSEGQTIVKKRFVGVK